MQTVLFFNNAAYMLNRVSDFVSTDKRPQVEINGDKYVGVLVTTTTVGGENRVEPVDCFVMTFKSRIDEKTWHRKANNRFENGRQYSDFEERAFLDTTKYSIRSVMRTKDGEEFSEGDIVKVKDSANAVKGWDRNPPQIISHFFRQDDGKILATLESKTPCVGDQQRNKMSGAYMSGAFSVNDFEKFDINKETPKVLAYTHNGSTYHLMDWKKFRCYTQPTYESTGFQHSHDFMMELYKKGEVKILQVETLWGEQIELMTQYCADVDIPTRNIARISKFHYEGINVNILYGKFENNYKGEERGSLGINSLTIATPIFYTYDGRPVFNGTNDFYWIDKLWGVHFYDQKENKGELKYEHWNTVRTYFDFSNAQKYIQDEMPVVVFHSADNQDVRDGQTFYYIANGAVRADTARKDKDYHNAQLLFAKKEAAESYISDCAEVPVSFHEIIDVISKADEGKTLEELKLFFNKKCKQ